MYIYICVNVSWFIISPLNWFDSCHNIQSISKCSWQMFPRDDVTMLWIGITISHKTRDHFSLVKHFFYSLLVFYSAQMLSCSSFLLPAVR